MPAPASTSVSAPKRAKPCARSVPPEPSELRHPAPAPAADEFPQGQAVPLPSPAQKIAAPLEQAWTIEIDAVETFVAAMSRLPSPSASKAAIAPEGAYVSRVTAGSNVPSPWLRRIDTVI